MWGTDPTATTGRGWPLACPLPTFTFCPLSNGNPDTTSLSAQSNSESPQHIAHIAFDIMVVEPQEANPKPLQVALPFDVQLVLLSVAVAVNFHCQSQSGTIEIYNVMP